MDRAILTRLQGVDNKGRLSDELDNEDLSAILGETDTDMGRLRIGKNLHLCLHLEQETVSIHMLSHLGEITTGLIVIQMRVTNDSLLLWNEFVVLAKLLELALIRVVPLALVQEVFGVLVCGCVRVCVQVDLRVAVSRSEVVNGLDDLTSDLTHLVKGWQVCILRILIEIQ